MGLLTKGVKEATKSSDVNYLLPVRLVCLERNEHPHESFAICETGLPGTAEADFLSAKESIDTLGRPLCS